MGFLGGASGKESTCQCRRHKTHGFDPWVGDELEGWDWHMHTTVFKIDN